ncbi:MAG: hypothetical protein ACFFB0_03190 [Promethearchaeota archaeon]
MDEQKEGEFKEDIDEDGFDPTKEAFFSDLMEMEEDIASEAYELVEHAMGLIQSQYYDDAIEVLRQAIGMYTQINREEEIKAINNKISEIYLLKEKIFRESEITTEVKSEKLEEEIGEGEVRIVETEEIVKEKEEEDFIETINSLLKRAKELIDEDKFEEALDNYDEIIGIYEDLGKSDEIEKVYVLIEEVYNKKADYLRSIKKEPSKIEIEFESEEEILPREEELKEEKLQQYFDSKKREEEISSRAYELLGIAAEHAKSYQYDQALQLYIEGANLFKQLNWTYEVKKVEDTIDLLHQQKTNHLKELERQEIKKKEEIETQSQQVEKIKVDVKDKEEEERIAKLEKLKGIEFQKMENEYFKAQVDNMATEAARMGREYELAMQKAIKKGKMIEECIYPKVIEIYKRIKELLVDKGWRNEAKIYDETIDIYIQKFEQDKKIRQIEAEKVKKQKEAEEMLRVPREEHIPTLSEEKVRVLEEQRRKESEIRSIKENLDEMTNRAEKIAREYEVALRKGRFELKCPFPEIINIYKKARQIALERGWETDAAIFLSQIQSYNEKLQKDKKLRQIEIDKRKKEVELEEISKVKKEEKIKLDKTKLERIEEEKRLKEEEGEFNELINKMINKAKKLAREYDLAMKKAIREGSLAENPPFEEIIKIYERVKQMVLSKGRNEEAAIYANQILLFSEKLKKDLKLREVEAQKAERQRKIEEMHKVDRKSEIDEVKLKAIEKKKEEEEFEKDIADTVNKAEKHVRDHETAMRKALREGRILEKTPYQEVIEIYKELRDKVLARGWEDQARIYSNQIKIYQDKLEKHEKLLEVETQKAEREKLLEEMHKVERKSEIDEVKLKAIEKNKEEEEFEKHIADMVNKAEKLVRNHEIAMRKALREGFIIEDTPYPNVIALYKQINDEILARGWEDQARIYSNQIKLYQDKLKKHENLLEVEAQKAEKEKQLEEMRRVGRKSEVDERRIKAIERKKEEEAFEKSITGLINQAEKLERDFERAMKKTIKKGEMLEQTPYVEIIDIYKEIKEKVLEKGWGDQASIYSNQIKLYQDKLERHKKLLEVEAQKAEKEKQLEEMHKVDRKSEIDKGRIKAIEIKKEEEEEFEKFITDLINKAEKLERDFERTMKKTIKKGEMLEQTPYIEIIDIYKEIKEKVLEKGWGDQASIYSNQIKLYKDKLEKHKKLLEVEAQKAEKENQLKEIHKVDRKSEVDERRIKAIESKKEEEEFEKFITDLINKAEKLERDFERAMNKAMKKGEIFEQTPYAEIIDIYKEIKENILAKGWREQSEIYTNQIKLYQDKLEKHEKLLEVEAQKAEREKQLEEMQRVERKSEIDQGRLKTMERKKEEEDEFERTISDLINQAEKLERDFERAMKKAIKKGEMLEQTPYVEIMDIYEEIKEKVLKKGWGDQASIYSNQIKFYQDKLEKHEKLLEVEAQKAEKEKQLEEMHKIGKKEVKPYKPEKIKEIEEGNKEEDIVLNQAMNLIDEAEKLVKNYELSIKSDVLLYESPYNKAIENYEEAQKLLKQIDWNEEAIRLIKTIKFYKEKKDKDEKLREFEKKKLEEPEPTLLTAKVDTEKELLAREEKILEFEKKKKEEAKVAEEIFNKIHKAERMAQEYEVKIKDGVFEQEAPYEDILKIYRDARKDFEEIGWMEESMKLINTIQFYKEKLEKDKKLRLMEIQKEKKREKEILMQQKLLQEAKEEQERFLKQKEEALILQKEKASEFESAKNSAFNLMDLAKNKLQENNFDEAIELYKASGEIFSDIGWQEGIKMVNDSIIMIKKKKESLEFEKKSLEERRIEKVKIEEKLEEKLAKAEELRILQQEEKRKELLRIQREKEWESEISEDAYELLEQGTILLEANKFDEAYEKYIEARKLFNKISWKREVSRINNDLLFKLKRERKKFEILEDIKVKKAEEEIEMEKLKQEADRKRRELEKKKKEDKRKFVKEEIGKEIKSRLRKAEKLLQSSKYNEVILLFKQELTRLKKLGNKDEIEKISDQINDIIAQAQIPLITLEVFSENEKYKSAYKALDNAQFSISNNRLMKAISELNEAKFNLKKVKIDKKFIKEIDNKISEFREKLGKKPEVKGEAKKDEMERLKARIATRREERKKRVLDLLRK